MASLEERVARLGQQMGQILTLLQKPLKIPRSEWLHVVQRVAQGESLRQVARSYRVSYEAIRRILVAARRSHAHGEEEPLL